MAQPNTETPLRLESRACLVRHVARVTIELSVPMHIGAGREWGESDAGIVFDGNGLPAIPGSTIAGVLRSAYLDAGGDAHSCKLLFGFQGSIISQGDRTSRGVGQGSRLSVSWGCIHDSEDKPVDRLVDAGRLEDEVLRNALRPGLRDHVRIDRCGVAAPQGKFDELVVCAGHRFTFELEFCGRHEKPGQTADEDAWKMLLDLLVHPLTRIGGRTRRGFGRVKVISCRSKTFDLTDKPGFAAYLKLAPGLGDQLAEDECHVKLDPGRWKHAVQRRAFSLKPRFFWLFGGGRDEHADIAPVRDWRIIDWSGGSPRPDEVFYIPGSSVKGALRHRALFHAYALCGHFADRANPDGESKARKAIEDIFGNERTGRAHEPASGEQGKRGRLLIDDLYLPGHVIPRTAEGFLPESCLQHHVSIDRFTGGAREGALFAEKPLFQGEAIELVLLIDARGLDANGHCGREALDLALKDLCEGRLALGGGSGRGLGYFEGLETTRNSHV